MERLIKLEEIIIPILLNNDKSRSDDMYLYKEYLRHRINGFDDTKLSKVFEDSEYRKINKIKPMSSVARCRRKLQAKYIELKPTKEVQEIRKEQEQIFIEYAIMR